MTDLMWWIDAAGFEVAVLILGIMLGYGCAPACPPADVKCPGDARCVCQHGPF